MKNPIPANAMFATPVNLESLMSYCDRFSGTEKIVAITCAFMTLNLAHKMVDEAIAEASNANN